MSAGARPLGNRRPRDGIREIKLDATFDKVLQQALLSVGIVKIGLVTEGTAESESDLQEADQPYVEPVLLEDSAHDTAAKSWDQVDHAANRTRMPLVGAGTMES